MPDLTFVLDVPPETGLARVHERGEESNRFEEETLQFHRELRAAYREIAEGEPDRCVLIEASQGPDVVAVHVWMAVQQRLLRPLREGQAPRAAG
jgi:dTMP kinase